MTEFLPALDTSYRWSFVALALLGAGGVALTRPLVLRDVLLIVTFVALAYRYHRNLSLLAVVAGLPLATGLSRGWQQLRDRFGLGPGLLRLSALLLVLTATAAVMAQQRWGWGLAPGLFPVHSARLLAGATAGGRIVNTFHLGGYLAWALGRRHQILVDGRNYDLNAAVVLHKEIVGGEKDVGPTGARAVLMSAVWPVSGSLPPIVPRLVGDEAWLLVAVENGSLLFVDRELVARRADLPVLDKRLACEEVARMARRFLRGREPRPGAELALEWATQRCPARSN